MLKILMIAFIAATITIAGCATKPRETAAAAVTEVKVLATDSRPEFRTYDEAFLNAVTRRWNDLLDGRRKSEFQSGKVILAFTLHSDGRIADLKVLESTVNPVFSLLCQKAILDPAPYRAWPAEMREKAQTSYRRIKFSFHYE